MVLTGVAFVHKVRAEQSGPETQHLSLLLSVFVSVCHTYDCLFGHIHSFIPLQQLVFRGRLQERGREDELRGHCNELLLQWSTSPHHQTTHQGGRGGHMQLTVFHVMIVVVHTLAAHVSYSKPFSDCVFSLINATAYIVVSITCLSCRSPHAEHSPVLAALRGCGLTPPTLQSVWPHPLLYTQWRADSVLFKTRLPWAEKCASPLCSPSHAPPTPAINSASRLFLTFYVFALLVLVHNTH